MPELISTEPAWYCFQALTKKEHIAASLLRTRLQIEVFCPRITYQKRTRRGKVWFTDPLFPGYLFIKTDLSIYYRQILATNGIKFLVTYGNRVPVIPEKFIFELRARLPDNESREIPEPEIKDGTPVVLAEGPFAHWPAIVRGRVNARNRVKLLLDFLGRQMEVEVSAASLMLQSDEGPPRHKVWEDSTDVISR